MKSIFTVLFVFSSFFLHAQHTLTGWVTDADNNAPLEFAQLTLLAKSDSSTVAGASTNRDGTFQLSAPTGDYLLHISYIGYRGLWQEVSLNENKQLGELSLEISSQELREIEVSAAARLFRTEADKRVYNVENMVVSEGGTAIQVLETLPSVQLDEEGNILLRGSSNVLIYINGRPTNLTSDDVESVLEQYPASAIKDVELITNPSARYDAEGAGGIINIILKEDRRVGTNAQVNVSAGTGHKYTGGVNFNVRGNRMNFFANYAYQYRQQWGENKSFRENFTGNASPFLDQDYDTENTRQSHLARTGLEFDLAQDHFASVFTNINYRTRDRERLYNIRSLNQESELDSMYTRLLTEDQSSINYEFGLNYRYAPAENGTSLNFQASYALASQDRIEYFDQRYFNEDREEIESKRADQTYERPRDNNLLLLQADFEHELRSDRKIEAGLKSTFSSEWRGQIFNEFNFSEEVYETDDLITNDFDFDENVYAAYLIYSDKLGPFSYLAGLRAEYTATESYQPKIDSTHVNNYFNVFPSVFLNYNISENQDIQFSYSRRIRRPGMRSLMPFYNAQDLLNLRLGNPYLQPEFTDNFELSYIRGWEKFMFTGSVFYRNTNNSITRVYRLIEDESAVVTWTNANTRNSTGLELVNYLTLGNNFDATLTANVFYSRISGTDNGQEYSNDNYSWSLSLLSNWRIPNIFSVQLMGNYSGPIVLPQGMIEPRFGLNIGLRRSILNNRGTISLNVSDIFNTRRFKIETESSSFYQTREFNRESRVATLSFTYRIRDYRDRPSDRRRGGGADEISDDMF